MSKRLEAVCKELQPCAVLADIGCDHGFVCKFALENNLAQRVIATDISPKSLSKARKLLEQKYAPKIQFECGDGLKPLNMLADIIVIAGMGAKEIISILDAAPEKLKNKPKLVLVPHRNQRSLREYLLSINYSIKKDYCLYEKGVFYDIITAVQGGEALTDKELDFGKTNLVAPNADFIMKLDYETKKLTQKINQKNAAILQEKLKKIEEIKSLWKTKK